MQRFTLLLLFAAAACTHAPHKDIVKPATQKGTISGSVHFVGTACEEPKPGCDGPMADYEVKILAKDGATVVASTKSDATGHDTIEVPTGDYTIETQSGPQDTDKKKTDVTVAANATATLDLTVDTGVR
jgi:hypothetical protein